MPPRVLGGQNPAGAIKIKWNLYLINAWTEISRKNENLGLTFSGIKHRVVLRYSRYKHEHDQENISINITLQDF